MNSDIYKMSFSTGGLFLKESVRLAELFIQLQDWNLVKAKVLEENILQTRKQSTTKRIYWEITNRLKILDTTEMELFLQSTAKDQACILWVAICRHYKFINDFAVEVLHERYVTRKTHIENSDFELFFSDKAEWHLELERIKPSTRQRLRQVLFRIMREAGLLSDKNQIIPALLSNEFLTLLFQNDYKDLTVFPVFESVIEGNAK